MRVLKASNTLSQRTAGLLLPLSALPSAFGVGDAGPEAYRFVDFLAMSGMRWWQMLPIGPLGAGHSPYDSSSAFAGDPLYISLEWLVRDGWLRRSELATRPPIVNGRATYARARRYREPFLRAAFQRFHSHASLSVRSSYQAFCRRERYWLEDYCLYTVLSEREPTKAWMAWDPNLRRRQPEALSHAAIALRQEVNYQKFLQFCFDSQWTSLRQYAAKRGIQLIGDVAIYVAQQSADVWAHQDLFRLSAHGLPSVVAGVPPDYFSSEGQRWGNPLYRWERLAHTGYRWWMERLAHALKRFDVIRLDHFIGFYRVWEIPASSQTARSGRYSRGPGAKFFKVAKRRLGSLPFIAEDLGVVTPEVKALRDAFQLPGMKVLQFAFGTDPEALNYQPHRYVHHCVAYTGTHDNDTLTGWWNDQGSRSSTRSPASIRRERATTRRYLGSSSRNVPWQLIRLLWSSAATIVIVPVQDLLGLGSSARMNRPGTLNGNWAWRLQSGQLTPTLARHMRDLSATYERLNVREAPVR